MNPEPYIVAELSGNHKGDIDRAFALIDAAKSAGADAVKVQTYTADTITLDCDRPEFRITEGPWKGRTLYDLYSEASTPWDWHPRLFEYARKIGLEIFSSPFDHTAVDFLESLDCPFYKIASFEIVDLPLIRKCAATGKPVIISTGMASDDEIEAALDAAWNSQTVLLHCVSGYPTPPREANLGRIRELQCKSDFVGLSDHSMGHEIAASATVLGAVLIEKHLTLSRLDGGPDASFSMEPREFADMVGAVKRAWMSMQPTEKLSERASLPHRRSLYAVRDIKAGETFTADNIRSIRPGNGLPPKHYDEIIGRKAQVDIERGTPLTWDYVDGRQCPDEKLRENDCRQQVAQAQA